MQPTSEWTLDRHFASVCKWRNVMSTERNEGERKGYVVLWTGQLAGCGKNWSVTLPQDSPESTSAVLHSPRRKYLTGTVISPARASASQALVNIF